MRTFGVYPNDHFMLLTNRQLFLQHVALPSSPHHNIEVVKADAVALGERLLVEEIALAEPLVEKLKVDLVDAIVAAIQANQSA